MALSPVLRSLLLTVLALGAVLPVAGAHAARGQTMTFEAPVDLGDPATRVPAMDEIGSLGVRSLRVILYWQSVAPAANERVKPRFAETDPTSYDWTAYDAIIDGARERGWSILLTVSGPVPRWATNGARDNLTRPSPNEFRKFMEAVGRRYGAKVARWSIWNEPNQPQFLLPQYSARTRTPLSPRIYRNLFLAAQRGLRNVGLGHAPLLLGETSPRGTGKVVAPLTFLRGVTCLDARYRRQGTCTALDADGYAHHAYTRASGPFFRPDGPNDVTIGVLGRLTAALDRAARARALPRRMPVHLTEFGIQSEPDPVSGVSFARQAEYRSLSERIAWFNPRVASFSQYLLRDDAPKDGPAAVRYSGFETGLRTHGGRAKPSLAGFRLVLTALRRGSRASLWGLVRPATGVTRVRVEYAGAGGWRTLMTVSTDARGSFTRSVSLRAGRRYRLAWTAPDGTVFRGPPTRVYAR